MQEESQREEFSVYVFFPDGSYIAEQRFVGAETAVRTAHRISSSVGARIGTVERIIITDGGDCTCFEWTREAGVTYPERT